MQIIDINNKLNEYDVKIISETYNKISVSYHRYYELDFEELYDKNILVDAITKICTKGDIHNNNGLEFLRSFKNIETLEIDPCQLQNINLTNLQSLILVGYGMFINKAYLISHRNQHKIYYNNRNDY